MQPIKLSELSSGDSFSGLVLINSHGVKTDFSSKMPLKGTVVYLGKTMDFIVWDKTLQSIFNTRSFVGVIVLVSGTVTSYKDQLSLTVSSMSLDHGFMNKGAFFKSIDVDKGYGVFDSFVNTNITDSGMYIINEFFENTKLLEQFKTAWAASRMHDAQVGGLLNHTTKMLNIAKTIITNDPRLSPYSDLVYLGIIFHDIGKIKEYGLGGSRTSISFVGHRTFGVEMLTPFKNLFVSVYGEEFYYRLIDIVVGHHGDFNDKPSTVWGYIVHWIDLLESQTTNIFDRLEVNDVDIKEGQKMVWISGDKLVF